MTWPSRQAGDASRAWQKTIQPGDRGDQDPQGELLCLYRRAGRLELWDLARDRMVGSQKHPHPEQLVAIRGGCLTLYQGTARLVNMWGRSLTLSPAGVITLGHGEGEILVATSGTVHRLDRSGNLRGRPIQVSGDPVLLGRSGSSLVVGFREGTVERYHLASAKHGNLSLEGTPASTPVAMAMGPRGTVAVGYANGQLGLWDLTDGKQHCLVRLSAPLAQLRIQGHRLFAAGQHGDHLKWDLSADNAILPAPATNLGQGAGCLDRGISYQAWTSRAPPLYPARPPGLSRWVSRTR